MRNNPDDRMVVRVGQHQLMLTNLNKTLWPQDGYVKGELVEYYARVGPYIIPHLRDRPLSVVRFPNGIGEKGFYQKNAPRDTPAWVGTVPVPSATSGSYIRFITCNNLETLVWLANSGAVELNPWLSQVSHLDRPDFAVFDLDPSPGSSWEDVKCVSLAIRELLKQWGLEGYPKLSGASGIHIYVPIEANYTFRQVSSFVHTAASIVEKALPDKVTTARCVADRGPRVYIDYPQNARGQTVVAVYSVRALPGAPVSMPVTWDELARVVPHQWNIQNAIERIRQVGDLFSEVLRRRQNIDPLLQ